jgi:ATP synthase protein I
VPSSDTPPRKPGGTSPDVLSDLDRRIAAAREAGKPKPRAEKEKYAAMSMGWRITIELVMSIMVGAAMGWGVDSLFGSLPLFLIVFILLGFAAGVRTMLRTVEDMQRKEAARAAKDERA